MVWSGVLSWGGVCEGGSYFFLFLSPTLQSKTAEKRVLKEGGLGTAVRSLPVLYSNSHWWAGSRKEG